MRKFGASSLFLMSILLAGAIAPATNGFQMPGVVMANTHVNFAFAQESEDDIEDGTQDESDESEIDNLGQEVSDFVHNARDLFMEQREETRAIIDACRDAVRNAAPEERADIRMQCREDLNEVRESYRQLRLTYQDVFKEFRDHVRVLVMDARGLSDVDTTTAIEAINMRAQRDDLRDRAHEIRMQMQEEFRAEVAGLREQMREERDMMRDEIQKIREEGQDREELESMREQMREEQEKMREQMQEEREKLREQMQEEREKMQEEREKMREQVQEEREMMAGSEESDEVAEESIEEAEETVEESEEPVEESEEIEEEIEETQG